MVEIIPSLPATNFQELATKTERVLGLVPRFQIDVCDGRFVKATSWPMNPSDREQFQKIVRGEEQLPHKDALAYEVHFMTHNPEKLLPDWIRAGIVRVYFHVEAQHDFGTLLSLSRESNIGLCAALKIGTPIECLDSYIGQITAVQLMGIADIGAQGQPFDERVIDMIKGVRARYGDVTIQIDGAVNAETAPRLVEAGATALAPGSYVLLSDNPRVAIETLTHVTVPDRR